MTCNYSYTIKQLSYSLVINMLSTASLGTLASGCLTDSAGTTGEYVHHIHHTCNLKGQCAMFVVVMKLFKYYILM